MLTRLRIKNFKLLRDVELEFTPGVPTVLIGANSSGKSTVIEVLDFLSRCADDGLERAVNAHGGMSSVRTLGEAEPVEIETVWTGGNFTLTWKVAFDTDDRRLPVVVAEEIKGDDLVIVTSRGGSRAIHHGDASTAITDDRKLAFELFADPKRYLMLTSLREQLRSNRMIGALSVAPSWGRFSPDRASARDPVLLSTEDAVGLEGIGLATALYNLHTNHAEEWAQLERAVKGEFPFVKRIVFPADPGGARISFAFEDDRFNGKRIPASAMSDGMVAFLCLTSLLLHPTQLGVLALDEPDAHLHPSAIRRLVSIAHTQPMLRAVIIVTHSNALIDELENPAESLRIFEATPQGTVVKKLDAPALDAWRELYSMSELRQHGHLDPSNGSYGSES